MLIVLFDFEFVFLTSKFYYVKIQKIYKYIKIISIFQVMLITKRQVQNGIMKIRHLEITEISPTGTASEVDLDKFWQKP